MQAKYIKKHVPLLKRVKRQKIVESLKELTIILGVAALISAMLFGGLLLSLESL